MSRFSSVVPTGTERSEPSKRVSIAPVPSIKEETERRMASGQRKMPRQQSTISTASSSRRRSQWLKNRSRALAENWRFAVLTTVLTIYALFGDDCRLALTHKDMDIVFNVCTIISILVFTFEIVVSSLGQDEYFLGFFFMLDVGSTATLIFDLTWIGNAIFCSSDDDGGALRTSRAGRAGARASRTVRIIRLMRLVKLYKAYKTSVEQKKESANKKELEKENRTSTASSVILPGEGDDDLGSEAEGEEQDDQRPRASYVQGMGEDGGQPAPVQEKEKSETRVGKKLSDMTTRRVILLVLIMLFIMPLFNPSQNGIEDFQFSSTMGADTVYDRFRTYCGERSNDTMDGSSSSLPWCLQQAVPPAGPLQTRRHLDRSWYEVALLTFLYQHHGGDFAWRLFWMGVNSPALIQSSSAGSEEARTQEAMDYLSEWARLDQSSYLGSFESDPSTWDRRFVGNGWGFNVEPLSGAVKERVARPWMERCSSFVGVAVQPKVASTTASGCSTTTELRCSEREFSVPFRVSSAELEDLSFLFTFDIRSTTTLEAGLSMLQTIFICFAVGIGAMTFSKDANELLLNPIERMIAKMESIKDNPLEAMRLGDQEYRREEYEQAQRKEELSKMGWCWKLIYRWRHSRKVREPMETVMLEKTIIKLGGLLALGFGEAGAEIIGYNMQGQGGGSAGVNAMVPGQKVEAIIGFCTIRHFALAVEVLKERAMLFVNQVSEIVHGCVDDYHGAPNKNTGEAFLLVWRLTVAERVTKIADMAMMSFAKIVAELNKSRVLAVYRRHPELQQRLHDYRVSLGFGLHTGWAIEGAIGSEVKIDASYLSPSLQVASRLEAVTKIYGVHMLISHFMVHLCSQDLAFHCRLIDHVKVKGSKPPIRVYTIDLDSAAVQVVTKAPEPVTRNRFKIRQLREVRRNEKWMEDYYVWDMFNVDEDLISMRARYSNEFFHRFSMAYRNYEAGEWMAARDMLFTCHYKPKPNVGRFIVTSEAEWPEDGPTIMLLKFMRDFHYQPPDDWPGYREIPDRQQ